MSSALKPPTFMELYGDGHVTADSIDDFIDRWHDEAAAGASVSVNEFLGMTQGEYEAWVHDASVLPHILRARSGENSLDGAVREHVETMRLEAGAGKHSAIQALGQWLDRRGVA